MKIPCCQIILPSNILVNHYLFIDCLINSKFIMTSQGGVSYQDLLPIPHQKAAVTDPEKKELSTDTKDTPTISHALAAEAVADPESAGAAQQEHEEEVVDLGWNEPAQDIANPLVGGLPNDDLWILLRRFNKVCTHLLGTQCCSVLLTDVL
jgi:hypothetical protein